MARNGFRILDSDLHIMEPPDLWQRYTEEKYRHLAPIGMNEMVRDLRCLHPDGTPWGRPPILFNSLGGGKVFQRDSERYRYHHEKGWTSDVQIEAMDREGIDVATLYPTRGLHTLAERDMDPGLAAALARAYNNWLYDFCSLDPSRMIGVGMVSPFDVDDAIAEAKRCMTELGFRGIFMRANLMTDRTWHDPYYDPLWATLVEFDVPVGFHESNSSATRQAGMQFEPDFLLRHTYSHPIEQMMALGSFTSGGVFARFPTLRAAFLEGNCSWLPWLLWRLDEHWELFGDIWSKDTTMKPSAYFKRQGYVSVDCEEDPVRYAIDYLGTSNNIVFSTDYPHVDAQFPNSSNNFLKLPISEDDKRKILWDNCAAFYGTAVRV
jgi:predicted TIM-barrel fold metal-dependent hydrolase